MPINTLDVSKRLKELGFNKDQSEGLAQLLSELDVASATKEDLNDLEQSLKGHVEHKLNAAEERIKRTLANRVYGAAAAMTAILTLVNYLLG